MNDEVRLLNSVGSLLQEKTLYKCFCRVCNGANCPLHWHESYEICQIISGSCRFLVDGVSYELSKGDIICIDSCQPHLCTDINGISMRVFRVLPSLLLRMSPVCRPLKVHIKREELAAVPELETTVNSLLKILVEHSDVPLNDVYPLQQSLSLSLYFLLMEHFPSEEKENKSKSKERKIFFQTLEYVNGHFTEPISTVILQKKLFYPRGRLSAIFLKFSGIRLGDYLSELRIQRVNELLGRGVSITEAALSSGFQNVRSFNNIYKKTVGTTPSEFLKSNI